MRPWGAVAASDRQYQPCHFLHARGAQNSGPARETPLSDDANNFSPRPGCCPFWMTTLFTCGRSTRKMATRTWKRLAVSFSPDDQGSTALSTRCRLLPSVLCSSGEFRALGNPSARKWGVYIVGLVAPPGFEFSLLFWTPQLLLCIWVCLWGSWHVLDLFRESSFSQSKDLRVFFFFQNRQV